MLYHDTIGRACRSRTFVTSLRHYPRILADINVVALNGCYLKRLEWSHVDPSRKAVAPTTVLLR